jgi:hypothetical protein
MLRDIFLLENQLPWLVLEVLMEFQTEDVFRYVSRMVSFYDISVHHRAFVDETHRPPQPHILGLLRYYNICNITTAQEVSSMATCALASSAIELEEMGIHLVASNDRTCSADMSIQKRLIFGELSLKPLFLNDINACWLVNMAAFEACTSTRYPNDGFVISVASQSHSQLVLAISRRRTMADDHREKTLRFWCGFN